MSRITDLRDATATLIGQQTFGQPFSVLAKPNPRVTKESCQELVITVNGAAHAVERLSRFDVAHRPVIAVSVFKAVGVEADGSSSSSEVDALNAIVESLVELLMHRFPDDQRPENVEVPRLLDPQRLEEDGMFVSGLLVTFYEEFEAD